MPTNSKSPCLTAGCGKWPQHRSGLCRGCEMLRREALPAAADRIVQACQGCGRAAYRPLCVACRTGQTEVGLRQAAEEAAAVARMAERAAPAGPLYTRRIGRHEYDVMFDGSVR